MEQPKNDQAGGDYVSELARKALDKAQPADKPEEKESALGQELLGALTKKDPAALGRLFAAQVRIAVADALKKQGGR